MTNDGLPILSDEIESFLQAQVVEHHRTTPVWPQANSEDEHQNHSLLKSLQIANLEGKNCRTELVTWLAVYHSIPQATTAATPDVWAEMRTKLLELRRETVEGPREEVQDPD